MLLNLHLLRALAALAVVFFHTTSEAGLALPVNIGAHGVDLFFVISGFVMAYVGERSPSRFLVRRVVRIVPFYWAATLAVFAVAALAPRFLHSTRADAVQLFCSLFFIPRETAYAGTVPTLVLGWSLNYEMYFYAMFAMALAVAPRSAPLVCSIGLAAIVLLIDGTGIGHPTVRFYARPLVFEFVYGLAAYHLFVASERRRGWFAERPAIRRALMLATLGAAAAIAVEEFYGGFGVPRCLAAGVPAFVLVLTALILERIYRVTVTWRAAFLVGESSYVLYLIHPYVVYGLLRTIAIDREGLSLASRLGLTLVCVLLAMAAAIAIHIWFERPVTAQLRRWVDARPFTGDAARFLVEARKPQPAVIAMVEDRRATQDPIVQGVVIDDARRRVVALEARIQVSQHVLGGGDANPLPDREIACHDLFRVRSAARPEDDDRRG